jgi:peptide/nickel transport system permease protein
MIGVIGRRLLATVVLLTLVSILAFAISELGTDPVDVFASTGASEEERAAIRTELGRDGSPAQRYTTYMGRAVRLDLGRSVVTRSQISTLVKQRIVVTLTVAFAGILVAGVVGYSLGLLAAWKAGGPIDRCVRVLTSVALATPPFWFAAVLILIFAIRWRIFPATGWTAFSDSVADWAKGLVLPAVSVSLFGFAAITRVTRVSVAQVLSQDFVRSARVKGLTPLQVLRRHVLRNSIASVVPVIALQFVVMFGAAAIIENVFALPGLGSSIVSAATQGDLPVIQAVALVAALLVATSNLVADIVQAMLNPKVRV